MLQKTIRKAGQLASQLNPLNSSDKGDFLEAMNCVRDREDSISKRRGFNRYASVVSGAASLMEYKDRLLALDGATLKYDSDGAGSLSAYPGSFSPPSGHRMRGVEAISDFYFTTSTGVFWSDSLTRTPILAGIPQGLDISASMSGTGGSWFSPDTQVSYRIRWVRTDANLRKIVGAASFSEIIANPETPVTLDWNGGVVIVFHADHGYSSGDTIEISESGDAYDGIHAISVIDSGHYTYTLTATPTDNTDVSAYAGKAFDVAVEFTIPDEIESGDSYELYRSRLSGSAASVPDSGHFKILSGTVTASDIAAGFLSVTDDYDSIYLGDPLDENAQVSGDAQAHYRPPVAKDVAYFSGHMFYLNTSREYQAEVQLVDASKLADADTLIASGISFLGTSASENPANGVWQIHSAESTVAKSIELTAKSIVRAINRSSANASIYAYYISGVDDPPGKVLIKSRTTAGSQFSVSISGQPNMRLAFSEDLTSPIQATNEASPNRLYRSRLERPEAVPLLNYDDVGARDAAGLRVIKTKSALIILKEDGVWKLTGNDESSFVITELDLTARLFAPDTAVELNDNVYCLSNQGVVRINDFGVAIVSWPDEFDLSRVLRFNNAKTLSHAVGYESDRKYILFVQEASSDAYPTVAWVYNYVTEGITQWGKAVQAALVSKADDRLYFSHARDSYILKERKSFTVANSDYVDESIAVSVTDISTTTDASGNVVSAVTVDYTYDEALAPGFLFEQGINQAKIVGVTDNGSGSYTLTLRENIGTLLHLGSASVGLPIVSRIRWSPIDFGSAGMMKLFRSVSIYMERDRAYHYKVGFRSDRVPAETLYDVGIRATSGWGNTPWGKAPWGDRFGSASTPIRMPVPRSYARARALSVVLEHRYAAEYFHLVQLSVDGQAYSSRTVRTRASP